MKGSPPGPPPSQWIRKNPYPLREQVPTGTCQARQGREIRDKVKEQLLALKDPEGNQVIRRVFEKEEIYRGPFAESGPDMVCILILDMT